MFDSKDFSLIQQIYSFEVSVGSATERESERARTQNATAGSKEGDGKKNYFK